MILGGVISVALASVKENKHAMIMNPCKTLKQKHVLFTAMVCMWRLSIYGDEDLYGGPRS